MGSKPMRECFKNNWGRANLLPISTELFIKKSYKAKEIDSSIEESESISAFLTQMDEIFAGVGGRGGKQTMSQYQPTS